MIRKLVLLAPFALLGLAACDGPTALTKAQPGECYAVVGREANGAPKWAKADCASPEAAAAAPATASAAPPATAAASSTAACPTTPTVCPKTSSTVRAERVSSGSRRAERRSASGSRSRIERDVEVRDYVRVPQDDYRGQPQELFGGPPSYNRGQEFAGGERFERNGADQYSYRSAPAQPPAPPVQRNEPRSGGERDFGRAGPPQPPAPPPPPPPPPPGPQYDTHGDRAPYLDGEYYSEQRSGSRGGERFDAPPPPRQTERQSGGRSQSYSSREYEQRSYSSSSSSSSSSSGYVSRGPAYVQPPCCETARGNMAPMNGPHFPVDSQGYLTWRGKTPGY